MVPAGSLFLFLVAASSSAVTQPQPHPQIPAVITQQPQQTVGAQQRTNGAALFLENEMARGASQCKSMTLLTRGVVAEAGRRILELVVHNSGDEWLSSALSVDLFQKGEPVAQFRSALRTIGPGHSQRHRIDLSELPPGKYQALSIVQNRDGDISGTRDTLEIE